MVAVAVIVAWFIYRRSVAYEVPDGAVSGRVTVIAPSTGGGPRVLSFGASTLTWAGGIPVLRSRGDAHTLGAAHGRLLAPALPHTIEAWRPSIEETVSRSGLLGGTTHGMRLAWRWRFVDDGMIDADRRMLAGLARGAAASGASISYEDAVRTQAALDVGAPSPRTDEAEQKSLAQSLTVIAQQADAPGRLWIGRQFALPGLDDGGESATPVVTFARPEGRIAWAGVGWASSVGVVTGVNAHGIALMLAPARTGDVRPTRTARPIALLARSVLEYATTLDEAIKMVESTPTLGAAAFVLVDGPTGRWVVVERTPTKAITERKPKGPVVGDVLTTHALSTDPENDRARRMLPTLARTERAARLVRAPLANVGAVAAILRDRRAVDDSIRPDGHRGTIDDGRAAHDVILDPASLELWVSDPAAAGRMRAFDLRHELRGDGERPAPPADVAADPTAEPERADALRAARSDLRAARAWLHSGDHERAQEACARARTRTPTLPEALELEAMIALARGDQAGARAAFGAWLDAGSDDPKGEERARAILAR